MITLEMNMVKMMYLAFRLYLWNLNIFGRQFCQMLGANVSIDA